MDSHKDQENVVQYRAIENVENVQLGQNQFLTQQLRIYEEVRECITPEVFLRRNTEIPGDGNCLFHSLIWVLQMQISTGDLRRLLRESPYLNCCHNPKEAYNILSSNNDYGDLDCLYLFSKMYDQNICVHYHYFNVITKNEDTRFCQFKANDTHNWSHLDLRDLHFTPYFEVQYLLENNEDISRNEVNVNDNIRLLRDNTIRISPKTIMKMNWRLIEKIVLIQMLWILLLMVLFQFTQIITSTVEVILILIKTLRIILLVIRVSFAIDYGGKET